MQIAPLYEDVAGGPAGGKAYWMRSQDNMRIRVAHWTKPGLNGTILLFPGRSEYIEKYGRAVQSFMDRGYATVVVDWRGQGIADRFVADRGLGHVRSFRDYQRDVAAMLRHVRTCDLPQPFYLVAHSLGGAIGLRSLMQGLQVNAAMFSAPMWGINIPLTSMPFVWGLTALRDYIPADKWVVPGRSNAAYLAKDPFETNALTNDSEMYDYFYNQIAKYPDLALGAPSVGWLLEALSETKRLAARPSPNVPALTFLGTEETIVSPARIKDRMNRWPNGRLSILSPCKHETMIETPDIRDTVFDTTAEFFDSHR